jgi:LacI family transcriptional regulator
LLGFLEPVTLPTDMSTNGTRARKENGRPVTMRDVASAAGVSVATVSRVLNGSGSVTSFTRHNVQQAVARLAYVPDNAARSLSTRNTRCIGMLLPDLYGEFFSELIRGVDRAVRARGLHLLLSCSHGDAAEARAALEALRGRVDGMLIMSPHVDGKVLSTSVPSSVPTVLMNTHVDANRYSTISIDNAGGAGALMRHLVGRGHRGIAHIAGPEDNVDAKGRLSAYLHSLAELLPGATPQVLRGDFTEESGYRAGRQLVSLSERPDAVFAANDMMAIGCLFALSEAGIVVPDEIALAGFDDVPIARFVSPPLTTVRIRIAELGELALERLVTAIEAGEQDKVTRQTLRTELVVRSSCSRAKPTVVAVGGRRRR